MNAQLKATTLQLLHIYWTTPQFASHLFFLSPQSIRSKCTLFKLRYFATHFFCLFFIRKGSFRCTALIPIISVMYRAVSMLYDGSSNATPADTWLNNNVIITSKRRRFDVIMTLLLSHVSAGTWPTWAENGTIWQFHLFEGERWGQESIFSLDLL